MKRVCTSTLISSFLTFFVAFFGMTAPVFATTIQEMPPKVIVEGTDPMKYQVSKTITEREVIVTLKEKESRLSYSWSFEKDKVGEEIRLNFELNFISPNQSQIDQLAQDNDKLYLSFKHHGNLPSKATIRLFVGDRYTNGEQLYLYYYNEDKKVIEYIDKNLKVQDGYVTFQIDHCSDYFLTTTIVNDAVNNPKSMNYIIVILVVVVIILVGATLFSTKK